MAGPASSNSGYPSARPVGPKANRLTARLGQRLDKTLRRVVVQAVIAFCSRCHSEIRVTELRMPSRPISTQGAMHGPIPRGVPIGSISFCPVHGLGFK